MSDLATRLRWSELMERALNTLKKINICELEDMQFRICKAERDWQPKTVVFGLDGVLIKSFPAKSGTAKLALDSSSMNDDSLTGIDAVAEVASADGDVLDFLISFRPNLRTMLRTLKEHFEIVLFSSSEESYAVEMAKAIEGEEKIFSTVLSRQHCSVLKNGVVIKPIEALYGSRTVKDIVIVDRDVQYYLNHLNNGVFVSSYDDKCDDLCLTKLTQYLLGFVDVPDVRTKIMKDFSLEKKIQNSLSFQYQK